jgi:hypothetical protein
MHIIIFYSNGSNEECELLELQYQLLICYLSWFMFNGDFDFTANNVVNSVFRNLGKSPSLQCVCSVFPMQYNVHPQLATVRCQRC